MMNSVVTNDKWRVYIIQRLHEAAGQLSQRLDKALTGFYPNMQGAFSVATAKQKQK